MRSSRGHILAVACVLFAQTLVAQEATVYTDVTWNGVRSLDRMLLRQALQLPLPHTELQSGIRRVAEVYYRAGFLDASIQADTSATTRLQLRVTEGEPARIEHFFLRGIEALSESEVRARLGIRPGDPYRSEVLELRLEELLREYARRGYLYANAVVERVEIGANGVTLGIAISEGKVVTLHEVAVQGNHHSRSQLVERMAGLRLEQPADMGRIEEATQLLRGSGLFETVEEPLVYRTGASPEDVGVLMRVVEVQRRNTVFGTVGVARNPVSGDAYVNGAVDLQLRNIWGTGRDVDVDWRRDAIRGTNLYLGYRQRFLFGSPFDLELELGQTVRDSTYTYQTLGLGLQLPVRRSLALQLGSAIDRSVFHTSVMGNSLRLRQRIGLKFQSVGREVDGSAFGVLSVHLEYARKTNDLQSGGVADDSKVRQTVWRGQFDAGIPLWRNHVIGTRGQWYLIDSNELEIPESEQFWFGGARTLRGYREDQFRGDQVALASLEYRIGNPRMGRLYAFVDAGGLRRKQLGGVLVKAVHIGFGMGLRARVPTGVFDLSIGVGEERTFSEAKVHVSLQQRF